MKSPQTLQMEQTLHQFQKKIQGGHTGRINQMMDYHLVDCNAEEKSLTFSFSVKDWMMNPTDVLHGGLLCTMFDISCGSLSVFYSKGFTPTVSLSVSFLLPVQNGDTVLVTARATHIGRTISNISAEAKSLQTGKVCGNAMGTFFAIASKDLPI